MMNQNEKYITKIVFKHRLKYDFNLSTLQFIQFELPTSCSLILVFML